MTPLTLIEAHAAELRTLGAQRIGVFGSFAREDATAESDVDVYLEFAEGRKNYDNFFAIHELFEGLFGRPIDLVTDGSLSERKARTALLLPFSLHRFVSVTTSLAKISHSNVKIPMIGSASSVLMSS